MHARWCDGTDLIHAVTRDELRESSGRSRLLLGTAAHGEITGLFFICPSPLFQYCSF